MAAKKGKKAASEKTSNPAASEISEPRWSVVSFESVAAKNLSYSQAAALLEQLDARKTPGLCIITDEAAARISE